HSLVPNFEHSSLLQRRLQSMRAECAETDCEKTERGGNAKKRNSHPLFPAEEFPERLNDAVRQRPSLLPEVLQFLRELRLRSAVNFANDLRHLVIGQRNFVGSPGCVAASRREMIGDRT